MVRILHLRSIVLASTLICSISFCGENPQAPTQPQQQRNSQISQKRRLSLPQEPRQSLLAIAALGASPQKKHKDNNHRRSSSADNIRFSPQSGAIILARTNSQDAGISSDEESPKPSLMSDSPVHAPVSHEGSPEFKLTGGSSALARVGSMVTNYDEGSPRLSPRIDSPAHELIISEGSPTLISTGWEATGILEDLGSADGMIKGLDDYASIMTPQKSAPSQKPKTPHPTPEQSAQVSRAGSPEQKRSQAISPDEETAFSRRLAELAISRSTSDVDSEKS